VNKALACLIAEGRLRREGYKLYVAGSMPQAGSSLSIAVFCSHPLRQRKVVAHNLIEAAHDTCERAKVRFVPYLSTDGMQQRVQLLDVLKDEGRYNGVVIWPHPEGQVEDLLKQFVARGMPVVVNDLDMGPFDFVGIDNQRGMQLLVRHLHDLGHRELAYFTRRLAHESLRLRQAGFDYAAFQLLNDSSRHRVYELPGDNEEGLEELFARFRKESPRVTALCCSHDFVAIKLLELCRAQGINVPGELSVVGFDGITAAETCTPGLTTVAQDFYQMGVLAVELVIRRMQTPRDHAPTMQKIRVSPNLVTRGSSGGVPQGMKAQRRKRNQGSAAESSAAGDIHGANESMD